MLKRKFTLHSEQNDWSLKLLLWKEASSLVSDNFILASLPSISPAGLQQISRCLLNAKFSPTDFNPTDWE